MNSQRIYSIHSNKLSTNISNRVVRKHLEVDTLREIVKKDFQMIPDVRADNVEFQLDYALISALEVAQQT